MGCVWCLNACDQGGSSGPSSPDATLTEDSEDVKNQCVGENIRSEWVGDCTLSEAVEEYLQNLCDEGATILAVDAQCLPGDEFFFASVSLGDGRVIPDKFDLDQYGNRHDSDNVFSQFRSEWFRLWGVIDRLLAEELIEANDEDIFAFQSAANRRASEETLESIRSVMLAADPDVVITGSQRHLFNGKASKRKLIDELSRLEGLRYIIKDRTNDKNAFDQSAENGDASDHTSSFAHSNPTSLFTSTMSSISVVSLSEVQPNPQSRQKNNTVRAELRSIRDSLPPSRQATSKNDLREGTTKVRPAPPVPVNSSSHTRLYGPVAASDPASDPALNL